MDKTLRWEARRFKDGGADAHVSTGAWAQLAPGDCGDVRQLLLRYVPSVRSAPRTTSWEAPLQLAVVARRA